MAQEDDLQKIKELLEIMKDNELVEIEISHGEDKILLKRFQPHPPAVTAVPIIAPAIAPSAGVSAAESAAKTISSNQQEESLADIKSPLVGTFYATPSPDSAPFVEAGSHVEANTVVCIIEAMKVMNEIKAETSGTITQMVVTNGQAVEYGQVLFKVRPD